MLHSHPQVGLLLPNVGDGFVERAESFRGKRDLQHQRDTRLSVGREAVRRRATQDRTMVRYSSARVLCVKNKQAGNTLNVRTSLHEMTGIRTRSFAAR
jgi:hypothetical protein